MVNTKVMHGDFTKSLSNQIADYGVSIDSSKNTILNSTNKLVEFKLFIKDTLGSSLTVISKILNKETLRKLFIGKTKKFNIKYNQKLTYVKMHLNIIIDTKITIAGFRKKILELRACIVKYKEYKFLVSNFNEMLSDQIITNGYKFNMGHHLGAIRIRKKKRPDNPDAKPVNWKLSNLARAAIIAAGEVPYSKTDAPHGQKWLIRHTEEYGYYWYWTKYQCHIANRDLYSFNPTTGDNGNIKKLFQYKNYNPLVVTKYKE